MKKINKILTNVLLGALTLSSLGLANVQAEETVASVTINEGKIDYSLPGDGISFPGKDFSFMNYFTDYEEQANEGSSLEFGVNDQRSLNGLVTGWKVTASLSPFKNKDDEEAESLGQNTYILLSSTDVNPNREKTYGVDEIEAPKVNPDDIKLYASASNDSEILIWFADREENKLVGVDEWTLKFLAKDISLNIPNKELVGGKHEATITWTFSNTYDNAPED